MALFDYLIVVTAGLVQLAMSLRIAVYFLYRFFDQQSLAKSNFVLLAFFAYFAVIVVGFVTGVTGFLLPIGKAEAVVFTLVGIGLVFLDERLNPGAYGEIVDFFFRLMRVYLGQPLFEEKPVPTLAPLSTSPDHPEVKKFAEQVLDKGPLGDAIVEIFRTQYNPQNEQFNAWNTANKVNSILSFYPPMTLDPKGTPLSALFVPDADFPWFTEAIGKLLVSFTLEPSMRCEHTHILASSGHGKTQLFKQLIANDLETNASIVVMDSQGDIIRDLVPHIHPDRLTLIDPKTCPVPVRLFDSEDPAALERLVEMFEYVLGALELDLTGKMTTPFRYICMLMVRIPGANLDTMYEIMKNGPGRYHEQLEMLPESAKNFFRVEFNEKVFRDTRQDVAGRLVGLQSSEAITQMFSPTGSTLDIAKAMSSGKVILINTNRDFLGPKFASLLGRMFLVLISQAIFSRPAGERPRTYLYIDEFKDYAQDGAVLSNLFIQSRKYEVGLHIAHQDLSQLKTAELRTSVLGSAIKLTGSIVASDAADMARAFRTNQEEIDNVQKLQFRYFHRGMNTQKRWDRTVTKLWNVDNNRLNSLPRYQTVAEAEARMRQRFAAAPATKPERVAPVAPSVSEPFTSIPLTPVVTTAPTQTPTPTEQTPQQQRLLAEMKALNAKRKPTQYDEDSDEWPD